MLSDVVHWVTQTLVTPPLCQQSFPGNGGTISSQFNTRTLVHCTTFLTFWQRLFPLEFSVEEGLGNACSQGGNIWGKVGDYRTAVDLLVL